MSKNNIIFEHWRKFALLSSDKQQKYFRRKIKDGHTVKCVSARDVFTDDELRKIHAYCMIEPKMCYRTAFRLTNLFPDRVKYVEGEVTIFNGGIGIDHAWNLVDGTHYVDLTFELALGEDVTRETYVALGEYDTDVIRDVAVKTQTYGNVYNELYLDKMNKKTKKAKNYGKVD